MTHHLSRLRISKRFNVFLNIFTLHSFVLFCLKHKSKFVIPRANMFQNSCFRDFLQQTRQIHYDATGRLCEEHFIHFDDITRSSLQPSGPRNVEHRDVLHLSLSDLMIQTVAIFRVTGHH